MLEDLFAQGQDLVSLIMSNLWWILLVGLVIVCVGEILVEGLEEFIGQRIMLSRSSEPFSQSSWVRFAISSLDLCGHWLQWRRLLYLP